MAILERNQRNIDNRYWNPGVEAFPVKNRYTAGVAGQRFFEEIKDNGKIFGAECINCSLTFVPARLYCERCFARLEKWVDVGVEGTVYSFTVSYKDKSGVSLDKGSLLAAIRIADGLLIHRLGDCEPEDVWIGMAVKAEFKPAGKRRGGIEDISFFKPV
jgi:uncharacterized protein